MRERYDDSSPSARPVQRGAALLLAMLTLALMAEIAALVVADYGSVMELLIGRQDHAQSRWLARGAIDWARNVLSEDRRTNGKVDHLGEIWATRVPPTAVEDGEVGGEIIDASGLFNLNGLVSGSARNADQINAYKRLLTTIGYSQRDAESLALSLADWMDSDSESDPNGAEAPWYAANGARYQPTNLLLVDVDELRLVRGYTQDVVERLRPFVIALPESAPINVNTASPEVLVAVVNGLNIDAARAIAARRVASPIESSPKFIEQLKAIGIANPNVSNTGVVSRYFLASGRAKYGEAVTRMQVLLDRQNNWSTIVWQKVL